MATVMKPDHTRATLLSRLRDTADLDAWREFEAAYGGLIVGYARRVGLQLTDAEDVRQLVLMSLARSMPGFQYRPQHGKFRNYLGKVVRSAISRQRTRHAGGESLLDKDIIEGLVEDAEGPDARWEQEWIEHHCRRALVALRQSIEPNTLAVFERLLAGRTPAEVAAELGMTPEAVRQSKKRVKERLRAMVAAQLREECSDE